MALFGQQSRKDEPPARPEPRPEMPPLSVPPVAPMRSVEPLRGGLEAKPMSPQETAAYIAETRARWGAVVKATGMKVE